MFSQRRHRRVGDVVDVFPVMHARECGRQTDSAAVGQLQQPALRRVEEMHGGNVSVVEVDANTSPELVRMYHVLTVPTTVVLDASGFAHAINYGFANTRRLLEQVDAVMEQPSSAAS